MPVPAVRSENPVRSENAKPGSPGWYAPIDRNDIEGYTSQVSAGPGEPVQLHVSAQGRYRVMVYRLGWYHGVGGRLIACFPSCHGSRAGHPLPLNSPGYRGFLDAGWPVTLTFRVRKDWVSGYYVAKLVLIDGGLSSDVPFIVTPPPSGRSAILVQVPVNTWEAYNNWGGKSLYPYNSTNGVPAKVVSFNRPYADAGQDLFQWEIQVVRFLEREGYDVSYTTDSDVDRDPSQLLHHRLVLVDGHDEYWTLHQVLGFFHARAAGVNLAFFSSDVATWQIRYDAYRRTLVEYRSSDDPENRIHPELDSMAFADLRPVPHPPCQLEGIEYDNGIDRPNKGKLGWPYRVTASNAPRPWLSGTGLAPSNLLPDATGYEWDSIIPGCAPAPLTEYFSSAGFTPSWAHPAVAVSYTAPSGARVFATGDLQFNWLLDSFGHSHTANPAAQRFAVNILNALSR